MRGATVNTLQPHQILRLPRKMNPTSADRNLLKTAEVAFPMRDRSDHDPSMIRHAKTEPAAPPRLLFALARSGFFWKLQRFPLRLSFQISPHAAPATKSDTWTSPNAAPATKRTHELHQMLHLPQKVTQELYQMLHLPRKMNLMIDPHHIWNVISNARPIRAWSDTLKLNPPRRQGYFSRSPGADSFENYNVSRSGYHSKFHHMLRLPQKVTQELYQMLHLTEICWKQLKWHFQCATDPTMIRPRKRKNWTRRAAKVTFRTR